MTAYMNRYNRFPRDLLGRPKALRRHSYRLGNSRQADATSRITLLSYTFGPHIYFFSSKLVKSTYDRTQWSLRSSHTHSALQYLRMYICLSLYGYFAGWILWRARNEFLLQMSVELPLAVQLARSHNTMLTFDALHLMIFFHLQRYLCSLCRPSFTALIIDI